MNNKCSVCPRKCGADRLNSRGLCGAGKEIEVSKIMLHIWEEPPISGKDKNRGSGAIFFTHCPLGCIYCQNGKISRTLSEGKKYSPDELAEEMLKLEAEGAYNINCVSPTQYTEGIIDAVTIARKKGLSIPIVWNTGGYETVETIRSLKDTVDIFLTDFKYSSSELSDLYSHAPDYPEAAEKALSEMYRITGPFSMDESGMMKRGIIVRHLVLPGHKDDSISVLEKIAATVPPENILLSLMAQYTPEFLPLPEKVDKYEKIRRKITTYEYNRVADRARELSLDGFMQERSSATSRFTPDF